VSRIETVVLERAAGRPFGPRFGSLVHATLATVPLDADPKTIARIAATEARILGAPDDERVAASQAVAEVLAHPLLLQAQRCANAGQCHREVPITWIAPDGILLEGTIDLAFEDGEDLVVLDFKTDRELKSDFDQYRRQVDVYCRALSSVRHKTARGILLRV
jgi:ATP-dependent exoDNAse (exonuclease V) beta subunit